MVKGVRFKVFEATACEKLILNILGWKRSVGQTVPSLSSNGNGSRDKYL
jgi:hypothetical protein